MLTSSDIHFPVIELVFDGQFTADDIHAMQRLLGKHFDANDRFAVTVETVNLAMPSAALIKDMASWVRRDRDAFAAHVVGIAFAISSPMLRGALNFFGKLMPWPFPQVVVATKIEAEAWVHARLRERDLSAGA